MVDLAEIQAAYYMVAATGVLVAAIYYIINLRTSQKNMCITLTNNLMQSQLSEESWRKWIELMNMEWKDYDNFEKKYGSDYNSDNFSKRMNLWHSYNSLGNLLRSGLADRDTLYNAGLRTTVWLWVKFKPIIEENRRRYGDKTSFSGFEYLATEMMRMARQKDPSYRIPETFTKYVPDN